MIKPAVIDLSHHNVIPQSLKPAAAAGILGVIHKATEATDYLDPKLDARAALARDAGLLFGVYHFLRPGDMDAQAEHFLDSIGHLLDDKLLLCADHEDSGVSLDELAAFLATIKEQTGHDPVLYSGHLLKEQIGEDDDNEFTKYRLWLAQYTDDVPTLPAGFADWWLWQYTDAGEVPGIVPPVDLNAYARTAVQLRDEWSGFKPAPADRLVRIAIETPPDVGVVLMINGEVIEIS
jgi:lysozyme